MKKMQMVRNALLMVAMAGFALPAPARQHNTVDKKPAVTAGANFAAATDPDYVIGNEDMLAINVWKEPEISRTVPVRPDGRVSLPLVGDIKASGLTPKELQQNIKQALDAYLSDPEVSVIVQEVRSQRFNVLGEVSKPGSFSLLGPTSVLDAIALAGGFRDFAKTNKIYVLRVAADGRRTRIPFDYKQVVKGKHVEQNIELEPRDTVIVP